MWLFSAFCLKTYKTYWPSVYYWSGLFCSFIVSDFLSVLVCTIDFPSETATTSKTSMLPSQPDKVYGSNYSRVSSSSVRSSLIWFMLGRYLFLYEYLFFSVVDFNGRVHINIYPLQMMTKNLLEKLIQFPLHRVNESLVQYCSDCRFSGPALSQGIP